MTVQLKHFYSLKRKEKSLLISEDVKLVLPLNESNRENNTDSHDQESLKKTVEETAKRETIALVKHIGVFTPKVELLPPDDLICEECELNIASHYCEFCVEIFCNKCLLLCHQRSNFGNIKHPHEEKGIRELKYGDKSKIIKNNKFVIPENELQVEELMKIKDLSIPNSLDSTIFHKIEINNNVYNKLNKYKVHDIVVFHSTLTNEDSYGIILSEWDYRHGDVAPPIIRNDKAIVSYIIKVINPISAIGTISDLINYLENNYYKKEKVKEDIKIDGLEYLSNKDITQKVYDIANKLDELNQIKMNGPQYHFTFHNIKKLQNIDDISEHVNDISDGIDHDDINTPMPISLTTSDTIKHSSYYQDDDDDDDDTKFNIPIFKSLPDHMKPSNKNSTHQQYILYNNTIIPMKSNQRKYMHAVGFSENITTVTKSKTKKIEEVYEISENITKEVVNIIILSENEILYPKEKLLILQNTKYNKMAKVLHKRNVIIEYKRKRKGFTIWVMYNKFLRKIEADVCATVIQTLYRKWRCRNVIDELYNEWRLELKNRWYKFHQQFNYSNSNESGSVTLNGKIYFKRIADANRYGNMLILLVNRIIKYLNRKRLKYLLYFFNKWQIEIKHFIDISKIMALTHFDDKLIYLEDNYNKNYNNITELIEQQENHTKVIYDKIKINMNVDIKSNNSVDNIIVTNVGNNDLINDKMIESNNIGNNKINEQINHIIDERIKRNSNTNDIDEEELIRTFPLAVNNIELPLYHPSDKMILPKIEFIKIPKTFNERLFLTNEQILLQNKYKNMMKGPTNNSCWIILNRLAIGQIPYLPSKNGSTITSTSALLLNGINVFISLMTKEEEDNYVSILDLINSGKEKVLHTLNSIINKYNDVIKTQNGIISTLPSYEISKEDYESTIKERLRCNARISIANDNINKALKQRECVLIPTEWRRYPILKDTAPTINELLPIIWDIEKILQDNKNVYIYSEEGHGRVGMVSAILLGRLYGLTATDALYHVQLSHDTYKSQEKNNVKITCPQLTSQKQIVMDIINHSNRIYEGLNWRSSTNPELTQSEVQYIQRGTVFGTRAQKYNTNMKNIEKKSIVLDSEDRILSNSYLTWSEKRAKFTSPKSIGMRHSFTSTDSVKSLQSITLSLSKIDKGIDELDKIDETKEISQQPQRQPIAKRAKLPLIRRQNNSPTK